MILFVLSGCVEKAAVDPIFANVEVHDPSILKDGDTYYIFGSHLAAAKSEDLMTWQQISTSPRANNPLFPNVDETLVETLSFAETDTLWAPDVIQLENGTYCFYYNACEGSRPQSAMGLATSIAIEGPYEDQGIFLKSGTVLGSDYNANMDPNVVDPDVFYDKEGDLYMVYGSYSGGIFTLALDENTGLPEPGQGYGSKILGGYHARIEGPYILYSEATNFYYLFLSYGGLDANGGYNIRVARSRAPEGPYYDSKDQAMIEAMGMPGEIFHDPSYAPYGHKLVGNFIFRSREEEGQLINYGYVSPGHNSAYYEMSTDQYFLIFHTRFPKTGNAHQVRVHQFFFNEEGWPVVAPIRYGGETLSKMTVEQVAGPYRLVDHGQDITQQIKKSEDIILGEDGMITGSISGQWQLEDEATLELNIEGKSYWGYALNQYDTFSNTWVRTFTVGANDGSSLWAIE